MKNCTLAVLGFLCLALGLRADSTPPSNSYPTTRLSRFVTSPTAFGPAPVHTTSAAPAGAMTADAAREVIAEYCLGCHDKGGAKGDLVLEDFDPASPDRRPDVAEKMIRKLRAGMMPPPGAERPEASTVDALASTLETRLDQLAARNPNPGRRTFQRLNRAEYWQSVRDILGLDVDVTAFLPPDTISANFDNIADAQGMSATVLEGYLRAATKISRDAVGDPEASPSSTTYRVPRTASQLEHVEGAPFGTRGGVSVVHNFPA